jgi:hypothetical protein
MENKEIEKELKKIKENFELEKSNLRANYFLTIFVLIAYIIIKDNPQITIFNYIFNELELFIGTSVLLILFFIKDLIRYSQHIVKKYVFKIK